MKSFVSLVLISFSLSALAQEFPDVSGEWVGSASFLGINIKIKYEVSQRGKDLEGFIYNNPVNQPDSSKKKFVGVIEDGKINIDETEYVYKVGGGCLSKVELEFEDTPQHKILTGKWKGDWRLNTCAPGASGPVMAYQSKTIPIAERNSEPQGEIQSPLDDLGAQLVNELGKREYYALLIGVNQYQDSRIESLDNPISDARSLAEVLEGQYSFKKQNVTLLENPTRAEIIDKLDELTTEVKKTDNLLVFYAGHGIWNNQLNQGYWLPSDASQDSKSYWLSNSTLRDYLGGIRSKHTLLISDACFSGGILKDRAMQESSKAILELYRLPSRKAMTSGTMTTVPDNSVFIKYLLKGLETNNEALISADQLFRTFKVAVIHNSPTGQVPQYGAIIQTGDEGGDFIFLKTDNP